MVIFKILNINIKNITHTKNNSKFYKNYKTTKFDTERLANTQTDRHSQVLNCLPIMCEPPGDWHGLRLWG